MKKKRDMIQCVCCATVFTKDGKPNRFFNYDDKHIYGCTSCKKGDWARHSRTTLQGLKVSVVRFNDEDGNIQEIDDTGYLDYDRDKSGLIGGLDLDLLVK